MFLSLNYFVFLILNCVICQCLSFTIEELKAVNYEVDILQTPLKKGDELLSPVVHVTSIFDQEYQCLLPQIQEDDATERITGNEKNTDIKELLRPLHTGNCLLKSKDWWTYELCFGQYIKQFHVEDGQIMGQILTLGLYDHDYDWGNETQDQEKFKHVKQKYHSQYYVNGTKCDLTGQPRVAEIRIYCEEDSGDYIHRVDEPATCSYVITVHTSRVCAHPQLKPLPSKKIYPIPCHPLLSDEQYSQYLEKLNENADKLKKSETINLDEESDIGRAIQVDEETEKDLRKLESFFKVNKVAVVKTNLDEVFEELIKKSGQSELTKEQTEYMKVLTEAEKRVREANLNVKKEESAVKNSEPLLKKVDEDSTVTKKDSSNKEETKDDIKKVNDLKVDPLAKSEGNEDDDSNNEDLQVRIRRLDRMHSTGKLYEIDGAQQKKLEKAIREKLERYGVNTGGRRIEVKIIKAGYYDNSLSDEEANQFENMITALLTGEQEAIQEMERNKKLEENYKFRWQNDEDDEKDE